MAALGGASCAQLVANRILSPGLGAATEVQSGDAAYSGAPIAQGSAEEAVEADVHATAVIVEAAVVTDASADAVFMQLGEGSIQQNAAGAAAADADAIFVQLGEGSIQQNAAGAAAAAADAMFVQLGEGSPQQNAASDAVAGAAVAPLVDLDQIDATSLQQVAGSVVASACACQATAAAS